MKCLTFLLSFLSTLTLALPSSPIPFSGNSTSSNSTTAVLPNSPTWTITNFIAYHPTSKPYFWSAASFVFQDAGPLPSNIITLACEIEHPIYRDSFTACGPRLNLLYKLSEGEIVLRRTYSLNSGRRVTGIATQGTYWADGANRTVQGGWEEFVRTEDWTFPVSAMVG